MPAFISAISTAVPDYLTPQKELADFMIKSLALKNDQASKLKVLYRASGIQQRYSVLPDFQNGHSELFSPLKNFPTVSDRMDIYRNEALPLAQKALEGLSTTIALREITHLIVVSCTGMYAPGLDIGLIEACHLQSSTERTAIQFMGCYAAFNGLKTAKNIVKAEPNAKVALVCIELCSIHLQSDTSEDGMLSNALFGDGAAAVLVTAGGVSNRELSFEKQYADLSLAGAGEMSWDIGNFGFEMKLSAKVPEVIKNGIAELTDHLLQELPLKLSDISYFAIHPGGKKIIQVIQDRLELPKTAMADSLQILKSYGNMSSPSVLFVIKSIMDRMTSADDEKHLLSFAFGPGLTLESLLFKTHVH